MKQIKNTYSHRGLIVTDCNYDKKFGPLQDGLTLLQIKLNVVAEN